MENVDIPFSFLNGDFFVNESLKVITKTKKDRQKGNKCPFENQTPDWQRHRLRTYPQHRNLQLAQ